MQPDWNSLSDDERAAVERRRTERDAESGATAGAPARPTIGSARRKDAALLVGVLLAVAGVAGSAFASLIAAFSTDECMTTSSWRCSGSATSLAELAPWLVLAAAVTVAVVGHRTLGWLTSTALAALLYVVVLPVILVVLLPR